MKPTLLEPQAMAAELWPPPCTMSSREGKTRVLTSARRGCPWCWTGAGPGEKVHRTCPQGPRPPGSAGGEAAYVAPQLHHSQRLPTASKASPPHSATKAFPWAPLCPTGLPMWTLSGAGPCRVPQGAGIPASSILSPTLRCACCCPHCTEEKAVAQRGTGLGQGHTARGWQGCRCI